MKSLRTLLTSKQAVDEGNESFSFDFQRESQMENGKWQKLSGCRTP